MMLTDHKPQHTEKQHPHVAHTTAQLKKGAHGTSATTKARAKKTKVSAAKAPKETKKNGSARKVSSNSPIMHVKATLKEKSSSPTAHKTKTKAKPSKFKIIITTERMVKNKIIQVTKLIGHYISKLATWKKKDNIKKT